MITQVTNGGGAMPSFKGTLSTSQTQDLSADVVTNQKCPGG